MAVYRPFPTSRRGKLLKHSKLANSRASFAQRVVRHSSELGLVCSTAKRARAGTRVTWNDFCCWESPAADENHPSSHRQHSAMELTAPRVLMSLSPLCFMQPPSSSPFPCSIQKCSSGSKLSATASLPEPQASSPSHLLLLTGFSWSHPCSPSAHLLNLHTFLATCCAWIAEQNQLFLAFHNTWRHNRALAIETCCPFGLLLCTVQGSCPQRVVFL